jgi:phosphate-selective porin OprO/OprP
MMKLSVKHRGVSAALAGVAALTSAPAAKADDLAAEVRALRAELRATVGEVKELKSRLGRYEGKSAQQNRKIKEVGAQSRKPAGATQTAAAEPVGAANAKGPAFLSSFPYTIDLGHGLTVASLDQANSFHLGGRIFVDGGGSSMPERGLSDTANLAQARLQVEGRLRSIWEYKFQYDFVGGSNAATVGAVGGIRDAYIALIYPELKPYFLPNPIEIQVGNFYLPHGMERSESKNYVDFVERSLMSDTFGAARHVGVAALTHGSNWTFKAALSSTSVEDASLKPAATTGVPVGVLGQQNWVSTGGAQYYDITARATYAPIWSEDRLLHVGASGRYHRPNDATAANDDRVMALGSNTASESNILKENLLGTPDLSCAGVPTGNLGLSADPNGAISSTAAGYAPYFGSQIAGTASAGRCVKSVLTFGAELSAAYGPVSLQAEYMGSQYNRDSRSILAANFAAQQTNNVWASAAKSFTPYSMSPGGSSLYFSGYYLSAMWFLTGESKAAAYQVDNNSNGGGFRQVKILHPLSSGGWGAWALTARLSEVDLNSGPFQGSTYGTLVNFLPTTAGKLYAFNSGVIGGRQEDVTLGVNWYAEPGIRVLANWTRVLALSAPYSQPFINGAHPNTFIVRTQVDW